MGLALPPRRPRLCATPLDRKHAHWRDLPSQSTAPPLSPAPPSPALLLTLSSLRTLLPSLILVQFEYRVKNADDVYRWHVCQGRPYRGPDGEILSWACSVTDVEELVTARSAATQVREHIRAVMAGASAFSFRFSRLYNEALTSFCRHRSHPARRRQGGRRDLLRGLSFRCTLLRLARSCCCRYGRAYRLRQDNARRGVAGSEASGWYEASAKRPRRTLTFPRLTCSHPLTLSLPRSHHGPTSSTTARALSTFGIESSLFSVVLAPPTTR